MLLNEDISDTEKPNRICSFTFVEDNLELKIILGAPIFCIIHSRSQ